MFLTRISVNNPVFATMMMLALVVVGLFSFARMGVDQFPDVDLPVVVVLTTYPGASPESVESEVTRKVEDAVNTIGGIDTVTSESYEGRSLVVVQFTLDTDARTAAQEVRDRVSRLEAQFADEVDTPQVTRFNPDDQPILSLAISGEGKTLPELTSLADEVITKRLNTVIGVGQTSVLGGSARQISIQVDPDRMQALGISAAEVMDAVRRDNQDMAAGDIQSGMDQRIVTVEGRRADVEDFKQIIVAQRGGHPVYLSQVADVLDQGAEQTSGAFYNGVAALGLDVVKVQGANTVQVAQALRVEIGRLQQELSSQGVKIDISRDNSRAITNSVTDVQNTLIEGGLLTVAIIFLFLNSWRSTVITALTLPISVIGTFAVISFLGFTLNTMTLMALSLAIGILIDDAIVVRENITRHLAMGKTHRAAALEGTKEIGLAVLATTLSIVAVFLPVAFMGGIIGRFFLQFGVTVSVAVLISLFVAFTLDPMLSSVWYDPDAHPDARRGPIGRMVARFDRGFERFAERYRSVIRWSFRHRLLTMGAALGIFVGSIFMVPLIGGEFVPKGDLGEFSVRVKAPEGSSLDYTAAKVRQVETALREFPEVQGLYSTINAGSSRGYNEASIHVAMLPKKDRSRSPEDLAEPLRHRFAQIAGLTISVEQPGAVNNGGNNKPLQFSILGQDIETMKRLSTEVMDKLRGIPGAVEVESSMENEQPTLAVRVRRDVASDLGVTLQSIGETLRPLVAGDAISVWNAPNGETYDVEMRLPKDQRQNAESLRNLMIRSTKTGADNQPVNVYLDQVADIVPSFAPEVISRKDLSRQVMISANISGRALGEVTADLNRELARMDMPSGYRVIFGGDTENMQESIGYAIQALALAVIFIYLILASQFGSFLQPFAIMATLPLSLIGVLLALLVTGATLNIFSIIGFIMLMGLVTKNAILLVDFSNQERERGASLQESLELAGAIRLRPIIMTTLAMIFGMMPLALGLGEGGEQRAPMAYAVIGGLISSTLLTLIVVPVILTCIDGFKRRIERFMPKPPADHVKA